MDKVAAEARYDDLHDKAPYHDGTFKRWSAKRSDNFPYHCKDGVTIWAGSQDFNPDDKFLSAPEPLQPSQPSVEE